MSEFRTFYRAARAFKWGTRAFRKGEVVRANDPGVERVNRERPELLLITTTCRPVEAAAMRSSEEPKPKRDWLAEDPSWRATPGRRRLARRTSR